MCRGGMIVKIEEIEAETELKGSVGAIFRGEELLVDLQ